VYSIGPQRQLSRIKRDDGARSNLDQTIATMRQIQHILTQRSSQKRGNIIERGASQTASGEVGGGKLDDRFHGSCHNEGIHLVFLAPIYVACAQDGAR
jgi:hypothetical protein